MAAWEVLLGAWGVCGELDMHPFIPQTGAAPSTLQKRELLQQVSG